MWFIFTTNITENALWY